MTRPMPGPPERLESAGLGDWDADGRWRNRWDLHWEDGRAEFDVLERHDKRLTGVECSAEFWRATAVSERARAAQAITREIGDSLPVARRFLAASREQITWHRFDTHHHALESDGAAS